MATKRPYGPDRGGTSMVDQYSEGGSSIIDGVGTMNIKMGQPAGEQRNDATVLIVYEVPDAVTAGNHVAGHGLYLQDLTAWMQPDDGPPPDRVAMHHVTHGTSASDMIEGIKALLRKRRAVQAVVVAEDLTGPRLAHKTVGEVKGFLDEVKTELERWALMDVQRVIEISTAVNPHDRNADLGWIHRPGSIPSDRLLKFGQPARSTASSSLTGIAQ